MTPTQSEVNAALAQIEREQGEYRAVGNHNRQLARERIAQYRVDDITEARINGERAVWPTDQESTERFKRMVTSVDQPRRSLLYPILLLVAAGFLVYALWRVV